MRLSRHLVPALLVIIVTGALFCALASEGAETTIEGWVESWEENDQGEVTAVYIDDGTDWYVVVPGERAAALLELVGQRVRATGTVEVDEDDPTIKRITVRSFSIIEDEEEPDEPYDEPEPSGEGL